MARRLVDKLPQALRDLADIAVYLAEESESDALALRFLDMVEACFEQLAEMPELGVKRKYLDPALKDVRIWRVSGFDSYLVFYRPTERGIEIIRVLHAKRDIVALFGGRS